MAQIGRLKEFQAEVEPVTAYLDRVELYLEANEVKENKMVPILLSTIGAKTYGLLRSLTAPKPPREKSFKDLCTILKKHFNPAPLVIAERYRFHRRDQAAGESVADYVAELRRLAAKCKFEDTKEFLEESLRDRFVCGLKTESVRKRLLTEAELTFSKAVEVAQSLETAAKDAQQLKKDPSKDSQVRRVSHSHGGPEREACYRCGKRNHKAETCRFKDASCFECGKKGHIKAACRSAHKPQSGFASPGKGQRKPRKFNKGKTKWLDTEGISDESEESSEEDYGVNRVGKASTRPIRVELEVEGKLLSMEVDRGQRCP